MSKTIARQSQALLDDIAAAPVPHGRLAFWWTGQHSIIIKTGKMVMFVDPYLTPNEARTKPPLLKPEDLADFDLILCTHDHADHIDPDAIPGIAAAARHARFVAPRAHHQRMRDLGVSDERLVVLNAGETAEIDGVKVTAIKAKHEFFHEDPALGFPFLGYVVEANGTAFYHSGDTLVYEGLLTTLMQWERLDVVFLPINGRDAERYSSGCIGNMTYQEAVDLAGELNPRLAVPTHYDMFVNNSEDPAKFTAYLRAKFPDIPAWVGPAGERVMV